MTRFFFLEMSRMPRSQCSERILAASLYDFKAAPIFLMVPEGGGLEPRLNLSSISE